MSKLYITKDSEEIFSNIISQMLIQSNNNTNKFVFHKKNINMKRYITKYTIFPYDLINIIFEYVDDVIIINYSLKMNYQIDCDTFKIKKINYWLTIDTNDVYINFVKYKFHYIIQAHHYMSRLFDTTVTINSYNNTCEEVANIRNSILKLYNMYMKIYYNKENYFSNEDHDYCIGFSLRNYSDPIEYMKNNEWILNHKRMKNTIIIIKMIIDMLVNYSQDMSLQMATDHIAKRKSNRTHKKLINLLN